MTDEVILKDKQFKDVNVEHEMKNSYLSYAMSVIVSRALPDVRDGLKPVHRRILYSMNELGITPQGQYRKSARVVGDVLGKYHPHGDSAVYYAMVRLAQDFNTRYLLVDGHGNFGSVDGDGAAAMRYTEVKMTKIAMEMLRDINKDTVDYMLNFDETTKEPVVLPSRFPNLLVNGSAGIAVGMATNMAPHNLKEVIDACVAYIDDKDIDVEGLMKYIKGPDFPTGALIMGKDGIKEAYSTGRGRIVQRALCEIEEKKGREKIVIRELPYQVNKAKLIQKIAELVRDKKIEGISDIRDESDRDGLRVVIDIKRDQSANIVLNNLYKQTQMQNTFGIINLALVNGEPKVLTLKELIEYYIMHQYEIITRRTRYDLAKAEARAHIVEGLRIALDHIDEIIKVIRGSKDDKTAANELMTRFKLSEIQASAILEMRLKRLTGLERDKLEEEYLELIKLINQYKEILGSERLIYGIIKDELIEIRDKYQDLRRTRIMPDPGEIDTIDMIEDEDVVITLTHFGYIKRMPEGAYKMQKRGGKGVQGMQRRDEDFVEDIYVVSTHDDLLFFTDKGRVYAIKAYEIPESSRQARGLAIVNLVQLEKDEKISAIIPIKRDEEGGYLSMLTEQGIYKRTSLDEFKNIKKRGLKAINLKDDDKVIGVRRTAGDEKIACVTKMGKILIFDEKTTRAMSRTAMGVIAMKLNKDDCIVSIEVADKKTSLLMITEHGYGKKTAFDEFKVQARNGKGMICYKVTEKTGPIVVAKAVEEEDEIMIISLKGVIIRIDSDSINELGRNTQGVILMKQADDKVASASKFVSSVEE